MAIIVVGVLSIYLINPKEAIGFYRGKIIHFRWLAEIIKNNNDKANVSYEYGVSSILKSGFRKSTVSQLIKHNTFFRGVFLFCSQIFIAMSFIYIGDELSRILLNIYLTGLILFFITLSPRLKIIGVADRYLEFISYFPLLIGVGYIISNYSLIPRCLLILLGISLIIQTLYGFRLFYFGLKKTNVLSDNNISDSLKSIVKNKNIFPISFSEAWKIGYECKCNVLYPPLSSDYTASVAMASNYPFPDTENIRSLCKANSIDFVLINKLEAKSNNIDLNCLIDMLGSLKYDDETYALFSI